MVARATLLFLAAYSSALGQLDLLTLQDARRLVSLVPAVVASRAKGECPAIMSGSRDDDRYIAVQARGLCAPPGGAGSLLIGNYLVDRATGGVMEGLDAPGLPVENQSITALARDLSRAARSRLLSKVECQCLVRLAAEDRADAAYQKSISVDMIGELQRGIYEFTASWQYIAEGRITDDFVVDARRMNVRERKSGVGVLSPRVGALLAQLAAIREPVAITPEEGARIARELPSIVPGIPNNCISLDANTQDVFALSQYYDLEDTCTHTNLNGLVEVDLTSGIVRDGRTRSVMTSESATDMAKDVLRTISLRRERVRFDIESKCGSE